MNIKCPYCKSETILVKPFKCKSCNIYVNPYIFSKPKVYEKLKAVRERQDLKLKFNNYVKSEIETIFGDSQTLNVRYYQIQGILHFLLLKRFLLGDATGIGKTIQSILAYSYMLEKNNDCKALVVAPKSAIGQWKEEFHKFTTGIEVFPILNKGGPEKRKKSYQEFIDGNYNVLVMNYHLLVRDIELVIDALQSKKDSIELNKFVCFFDEAAAFKTRGSKTWGAVHEICKYSDGNYALTATPIKNKLEEIYSIYKAIHPNLFPGPSGFQNQYCKIKLIPRKGGRGKIPLVTGYKNLKEFRQIIDPYYLGRKIEDIGEQLPDLVFKDIRVEMSAKQTEKYREAITGLIFHDDGEETEVTKLTQITYCQQIVSNLDLLENLSGTSTKEEEFLRLVEEDFDGEKIIAYTRFRSWIDILEKKLLAKNISVLRITGAEDDGDIRELYKRMFLGNKKKIEEQVDFLKEKKKWKKVAKHVQKYIEKDIDPKIILINNAGIEALNLQSARIMILLDIPISYGNYVQLLGRSRRLDSKHSKILVVHLMASLPEKYRFTTIDEKMVKIVRNKKNLNDALFGEAFEFRFEGDMIDQLYKELKADAKSFGKK